MIVVMRLVPLYSVCTVLYVVAIPQESSDDEGSDDTEGTLTHPISSSESESDGDDVESLASSVAELSSGPC